MTTHYRKITPSALREVAAAIEGTTSDYRVLASFGAVRVGKDGNGALMCHVLGDDGPDLPGKFLAVEFEGLKGTARGAVHRTRIKTEDGEAHVPEADVGSAEVLESGINPHLFA